MLQINDQTKHADYPQKFVLAVRHLFPILCFTPDQIEAFLDEFTPQFDGKSSVFEDEQGRLTFCRYSVGESGDVMMDYIIPSDWEARYAMVKATILALKRENSGHEIRMQINEKLPSHASYYMGLLPELGFNLAPRVTMTAPQELVKQLTLPELLPNVQEMSYDSGLLESTIDVFAQAYGGNMKQDLSTETWATVREEEAPYIRRVFGLERTRQTWIGLAYEEELIGCAFGGLWDNEMSLEEVVLVPKFHGQGLGRYLVIRCLHRLYELYHGPDKTFFLGTDRRWNPALELYHRLGFTIDRVESYATLTNKAA